MRLNNPDARLLHMQISSFLLLILAVIFSTLVVKMSIDLLK